MGVLGSGIFDARHSHKERLTDEQSSRNVVRTPVIWWTFDSCLDLVLWVHFLIVHSPFKYVYISCCETL